MIHLQLTLDLDQAPWTDLQEAQVDFGDIERIGLLRHGMASGAASVAIVIALPDGRRIGGQTSWAALRTAFAGLNASAIVAEEVIGP